ncbi:MAG: nitroreductase family protein [Candidatus Bathyarchaeota archaeon]|nr:MAG: nitroreductase family protein [Candidatus Bathyarchaeota archaeon]
MDFYDVIRTRRSIRSYRSDPISEEVLNRVMDAARIAPSGSNRQPWKFIIVKDESLRQRLASICGGQNFIAEPPVAVVACGYDIHRNRGGYMGEMSILVDVSIAFTHLIQAARAEGLGTCWIGAFDNNQVKELLNIPENFYVVAVTPLGYPREEKFREPGERKNLEEIVSTDKF